MTGFLGHTMLSQAVLSFPGLGVPEPTPAVFAFNQLGDSRRDAFDPRLRLWRARPVAELLDEDLDRLSVQYQLARSDLLIDARLVERWEAPEA
jgi:hypothetical protein